MRRKYFDVYFLAQARAARLTIFVAPGAAPALGESSSNKASTKVSNLSCNPDVGVDSLETITSIFQGRLSSDSISRPSHGPTTIPSCDLRQKTKLTTNMGIAKSNQLCAALRKLNYQYYAAKYDRMLNVENRRSRHNSERYYRPA